MIKIETLPNGLTLAYIKTNKKHAKSASIVVKFGGFDKKVKIENKTVKVKDGTAHFLEHLLIEHSMYGNMIIEFSNNNTKTNGQTTPTNTEYWFETTNNFEENLVKLINMVNNPVFKQPDIDEIKPAIIKEKLERDDNKYYEYHSAVYECLFKNLNKPNVLGNIKDIKDMKYDYIKEIYDAFYKTENQFIVINGNLNYKKTKQLIIDTYDKIKKEKITSEIPNIILTDPIAINEKTIKKDVPNQRTKIVFKINLSKYTPLERLKFDWYFAAYIEYLINELDEQIVKQKISTNAIYRYREYIKDYCLLNLSLETNKSEEYKKLLLEKVQKIIPSKESFQTFQKRNLIQIILREESSYGQVQPLIGNILEFDYYGADTIEFINSLNYQEFKKFISEINLSNYSIIKLEKTKK